MVTLLITVSAGCRGPSRSSAGSAAGSGASPAKAGVSAQVTPAAPTAAQFVTPSVPPSSACGRAGLIAETVTSYEYLLNCASKNLDPPPRLRIPVGGQVHVVGALVGEPGVTLAANSAAVSVDRFDVTGVSRGTSDVVVSGKPCLGLGSTGVSPCPLFTVTVS